MPKSVPELQCYSLSFFSQKLCSRAIEEEALSMARWSEANFLSELFFLREASAVLKIR